MKTKHVLTEEERLCQEAMFKEWDDVPDGFLPGDDVRELQKKADDVRELQEGPDFEGVSYD